jgi:polar amino acid transport system substrate-binding protein
MPNDPLTKASLLIPVIALVIQAASWVRPFQAGQSPWDTLSPRGRKILAGTFVVLVLYSVFFAFRYVVPSPVSKSPIDHIKRRNEIVIGVSYNAFPFGFKPSDTDPVQGFDVDIGKEIAKAIFGDRGRARFVQVEGKDRFSPDYLQKNGVDIVIATMSINVVTDARHKTMAFSEPYYTAGQRIVALKDSAIFGASDLAGKYVCVGKGENDANLRGAAREVKSIPVRNTKRECLDDLQKGAIDAISSDEWVSLSIMKEDPNLELKGSPITTDPYGIAVRKDTKNYWSLLNFINAELTKMKNDGRWEGIYNTHIRPLSHESAAMHSCG